MGKANNVKCKVCEHRAIDIINKRIIQFRKDGETKTAILNAFKNYSFGRTTFFKHMKNHINYKEEGPVKEKEPNNESNNVKLVIDDQSSASVPANVDDISSNIQYLYDKTMYVISSSERKGSDYMVLRGVKEARGCLEMVLKARELFLETQKKTDFDSIIIKIISTLEDYPDARNAVSKALNYVGNIKD